MKISLNLRHEKRLLELAQQSGKTAEAVAGELLEEALFAKNQTPSTETGSPPVPSLAFHGASTNLDCLISALGVKPVERFEDLLGDFWPDEERGTTSSPLRAIGVMKASALLRVHEPCGSQPSRTPDRDSRCVDCGDCGVP